jgi:hypothetical protein
MIIKTLKFIALLVVITSLSACASDSAPKANGEIAQASQPPSDVLDIEFDIENTENAGVPEKIEDIDHFEDINDIDDIDHIEDIKDTDNTYNFKDIDDTDNTYNFEEIYAIYEAGGLANLKLPVIIDHGGSADVYFSFNMLREDMMNIGATDKPDADSYFSIIPEDIMNSDPALENPSIARATDKPLQLKDNEDAEAPNDSTYSDEDLYFPGLPSNDAQQYWRSERFSNIDYEEEIRTFGHQGAVKGAVSAFKKMMDKKLIPDYNEISSHWMAFTGIKEIKGEDCYVYRFQDIDVYMSFACAITSGNIYYLGNGAWVSANSQSSKPLADETETYEIERTDPEKSKYVFTNGTYYGILNLVGTMPGSVYFYIYANSHTDSTRNRSSGDANGLVSISKSGSGKWVDPLGHGTLEFKFDSESKTVTVKDNTEGFFNDTEVSFNGTYNMK